VTEITIFDSVSSRHSSVALNLNTKSSIRFSYGVNNQPKEVMELITFFLINIMILVLSARLYILKILMIINKKNKNNLK